MKSSRGFLLAMLITAALAVSPAAAAADGLFLTPEVPAVSPSLAASKYPSDITGERYENGPIKGKLVLLKAGEFEVNCNAVSLDGGKLTGPTETLGLKAAYTGCGSASLELAVTMNSCSYSYQGFDELGAGAFSTAAKIACGSSGDAIKIAGVGCTVKIPAQTIGGEAEVSNWTLGGKPVVLAGMIGSGLEYTASGAMCALDGLSTGTHTDGSSESHMTLRGV